MAIDIDYLTNNFFAFDLPIEFNLKSGSKLNIYPIVLSDYGNFISSVGIIEIDKNSISNAEIIQMSYLEFLLKVILPQNKDNYKKFLFFLSKSLGINLKEIEFYNDDKGKPYIKFAENKITAKEFEDIRRIILYQNIYNYDDSYINPELKKQIERTKALKNQTLESPTLERRMAIISSHTGISKSEQLKMTLRSHEALFEEVCNEIEYIVTKPLALYAGKGDQVEFVFKKKKNKLEEYITSLDKYSKSLGNGLKK